MKIDTRSHFSLSKIMKYGALALISACIATAGLLVSQNEVAYADEDEYTFVVTISPGKQGTLNNAGITIESDSANVNYTPSLVTITNLHYGDRINFDANSISNLGENSKYYAKGIRVSGLDNITSENVLSSVPVTSDQDYVVAYGLKGQLVEYTVKFVGPDGNPLAKDRIYFGNAGDSPVIAHLYIDGYRPQAYNLTGTLSENPDENVFIFKYDSIDQLGPEGNDGPDDDPQENDGGNGIVVLPRQDANQNPVTGAGTGSNDNQNGAAGQGDQEGATVPDNENPIAQPQELLDINDNENPLVSGEGRNVDTSSLFFDGSNVILVPLIVTGIVLVLGIATLVAFLAVRRRGKKDEGSAS